MPRRHLYGSANHNPSAGTLAGGQTVEKADTAVSAASGPNPSTFGEAVALTATVTGSAVVEGTVTFKDNGAAIPGCGDLAVDAGGQARCATSSLGAGNHAITANYSGSPNFHPGSGSSGQRVNAPPVAAVGVQPDPQVIEGAEVVLDATGSTDLNEDEQGSLAFVWEQRSGPPVELTGADTKTARFTAPRIANPFEGPDRLRLAFELEATDPSTLRDKATVEVEVVSTVALLDPFLCYKASAARGFAKFDRQEHTGISLDDPFEQKLTDIVKPRGICNPAKKSRPDTRETSDIVDPATHLEAYKIRDAGTKPAQPKFKDPNPHTVTNQFGTLIVHLTKAESLLAPAAQTLEGSFLPPPEGTEVDRYKCYKVAPTEDSPPWAPVEVTLDDQFTQAQETGPLRFTLKKPLRLCAPVSQDGGEVRHPENHLLCYRATLTRTRPAQPNFPRPKPRAFLSHQFGQEVLDASAVESLCVPSLVNPSR